MCYWLMMSCPDLARAPLWLIDDDDDDLSSVDDGLMIEQPSG